MIRASLVSVVEEPDVSQASDLGVWHTEKLLKVFGLLSKLWKPDHRRHVRLAAGQELAPKSDLI